jgi:hypothetical protein
LLLIAGWRFNLADKELFDDPLPLSDASFSVTLFKGEPVSLFQSAIGDFNLKSWSMVVSGWQIMPAA